MAIQEQTKTSRIKRTFRNEGSPEPTPRAKLDSTHITFVVANGKSLELSLAELFGGQLPPPSIGRAAAAAGISNVIGGAGLAEDVNTEDPDEIMEAMLRRSDAFKAGNWTAERTGGGRPSMVWMAFTEWRKSKGVKDSEEKLASLRAHWFDEESNFKALQANPEFSVFLAQFKASRKKESDKGPATADLLA